MPEDVNGIGARIGELTAAAFREQVNAATRLNELATRATAGDLSSPAAQDAANRFAREEGARFAGEMAVLGVTFYNEWLKISSAFAQEYVRKVADAQRSATRILIELRGVPGGEATGRFELENPRDAASEFTFLVSQVVDAEGGQPFSTPILFEPAPLRLDPQSRQDVTVRVRLGEGFVAGHEYRATVLARGGVADLDVQVRIRVDAGT